MSKRDCSAAWKGVSSYFLRMVGLGSGVDDSEAAAAVLAAFAAALLRL